ncbi:Fc.00g068380.m01.CDS01 [Cosmosporella sp. VM-42]
MCVIYQLFACGHDDFKQRDCHPDQDSFWSSLMHCFRPQPVEDPCGDIVKREIIDSLVCPDCVLRAIHVRRCASQVLDRSRWLPVHYRTERRMEEGYRPYFIEATLPETTSTSSSSLHSSPVRSSPLESEASTLNESTDFCLLDPDFGLWQDGEFLGEVLEPLDGNGRLIDPDHISPEYLRAMGELKRDPFVKFSLTPREYYLGRLTAPFPVLGVDERRVEDSHFPLVDNSADEFWESEPEPLNALIQEVTKYYPVLTVRDSLQPHEAVIETLTPTEDRSIYSDP